MGTMQQEPTPGRWTYEHYLLFPNDGNRREIVNGDRLVTPSPRIQHQRIVLRLTLSLGNHLERCRGGIVLQSPVDLILSDQDVVVPDLSFVSAPREQIVGEAGLYGAPDLVVEVLSPSSRKQDEVLKRSLYEAHGVAEYWIVDPELETVKALRQLNGTGFAAAETLGVGTTVASTAVTGWSVAVDRLFA